MTIRIIKILFGILLIKSSIGEYFNYVKQIGHGGFIVLLVVLFLSLCGVILIFSGIRNKKIMDIITRKKNL
jgi:hypothetical protein